ncbi:MAG: polyphosphate polymerase domain-containing protein [Phaeodactylibacter sp.]|uniref:polyphosphate polymerase domain-containing protein n=1 Tax=Phaeodactylibacter sp. TaxID=1940289 RepID=UPI0032EDA5E6
MRYERKYRIEQVDPQVVGMVVRQHPAGFRTLYPPRQINNLYFDTPDFAAFQDNVTGAPRRLKYRLRWYGDDFHEITNPVLEVKIKDNQVGFKRYHPLPEGTYTAADWPGLVERCRQILKKGLDLQPVLFNTYRRSYWAAPALPFRLTIDTQMHFGPFQSHRRPVLPLADPAVVIEVKYDELQDEDTAFILQHLPFRLSKNSKYVTGINLCYG